MSAAYHASSRAGLVDFSEATDSGFLEELVASVFRRIFQRQLILVFLRNLLPSDWGDFFRGS